MVDIIGSVAGAWNDKSLFPTFSVPPAAWFDINTNAQRAAFNKALDGIDGTVIGAPAFTSAAGDMQSLVNYLNSGVTETDELTVMMLCRATAPTSGSSAGVFFASTHQSPGQASELGGANVVGFSMQTNAAGSIAINVSVSNGAGGATTVTASLPATAQGNDYWAVRCAQVSNSAIKAWNLTTGESVTVALSAARRRSTGAIRFGSSATSAAYTGLLRLAAASEWQAAISLDDINAGHDLMKWRAKKLGIVLGTNVG